MRTEKIEKPEADTHPDAWQRFEKAVDIGLRTKPMHKAVGATKAGKLGKPEKRKSLTNKK